MIDQLMAAVGAWGAPALSVILAINCLGLPFPTSLLLLAVGAIAADGGLSATSVLAWGIGGAVAGDQAGYWAGRVGGRGAIRAVSARFHLGAALARAEAVSERWGAVGVFLTRWLLSPVGPYVNLVAGVGRMPWTLFTVWGLLGEVIWVALYTGLGYAFADSIPAAADLLGTATWFLLAAAATAALGWTLLRHRPRHAEAHSPGAPRP